MNWFYKVIVPFQTFFRQSVESFIALETSDDVNVMVAKDGSLLTYLKVDGSRQVIGEQEYQHMVEGATIKIGSRFDRRGHAMQVYFVRDPNRVGTYLQQMVDPSRKAALNAGFDLEDVFSERVRHLSNYLTYEECYFVLWTRASILTKSEVQRAAKEVKEKKWVTAGYAQYPMAALDALRTRHKSFISAVMSALDELGVKSEMLEVHDAMQAVRDNLYPTKANVKWRACMPGDPIPPRAPTSRRDMSDVMWPPLSQQLAVGDAFVVDRSIVQIGDLYWAGADMTLGPMDAMPFPLLLNRLFEADIPWRISFLIEGGGAAATAFRGFAATILGVTNSLNKQIKFSLEGLEMLSRREPVVKLRVSFATWAPATGDIQEINNRLSTLIQSVESWGYCQVSEFSGDALDCVLSSAMGIHCSGTAPSAVAPMFEVMKLMPWQRPSSPFDVGSILLRTPDGKLWPYQTGTSVTTTWFDLVFAQPGAGKSVLLNALNLGTCLSPGISQLPYVAVIDIGPSSSGMISLIKEALPQSRQHEASYYRLQMAHQFAVNPFDTQLGCRYPLIDERSYLVELITLLCTPPGHEKPYDGIQQLAGLCVDEMYRWRDDSAANAEPRPFLPRLDPEIDDALSKFNVHLPSDPYWWDVVDKMYDIGEYHIAMMAQRHAVPTISDSITASRRPQIRTLLEETSVGFSAESVINAFERMITSAIREFPILASVTQFDITSRVCALDLMDVAPQGDEVADRQTSIMYMLARHTLVRNWWVGPESIEFMPEKFRAYHEAKIQDIGETPKRLCYDEFHRTSRSISVRNQLIRDVREGRKRGVQILLASQLLDDFDQDMIDLATGVWVLGSAISESAVENVRERFGLSETAREIIRYKLTGPKPHGAPVLLVLGTTEGRYEQFLYNTLGPIELWALSTSSEDVSIRKRLYSRLGAGRARRLLATAYPGGSARSDIKRRVMMKSESEKESRTALTSEVIEEIVEELVRKSELAEAEVDREKFRKAATTS